ncbi:FG-GAP-like repeat-containing protein [Candidatus Marifrigoribacter sp. Uisw_064]|uniref:FG-GAP-like repeat-containing protein n=1 Tax=Candidatus Marifrigoribacter sp. Uisw_064 TaxID=3230970 RepID=UPI003D4993CD
MKKLTSLFICLYSVFAFSQDLMVTDISPSTQSLSATPTDAITITFNQKINEASLNADTFMVFGRWSGPMQGTYIFDDISTSVTFTPDRSFFYGEWISVRLTNQVESLINNPLTNGYGFEYWIKTLPGLLNQEYMGQIEMRQNGETFIQCYGAYAGDVNDDEFSDLIVVNEDSEDIRILLNDGAGNYDGTFTLIEMPASTKPSTNGGADFNRDGMIDLAIGSTQSNQTSIFMGNDSSIFDAETSHSVGTGVRGLTIIDFNGDGWADIVTANRVSGTISFLENDGTGDFNPATHMDVGINGETAIAATDLNGDGFTDLIVGGYSGNAVASLLNDGEGNFTTQDITTINGQPWMIAIGDVNGDGFVDVATANSNTPTVSILFSDGLGNFNLSQDYAVGSFPLAIDLGDLDGDGDLDVMASNYSGSFTLYENIGNGLYSNPITYPSIIAGSCTVFHDRNNDGALDITLIDELADVVILYRNTPILSSNDNNLTENISLYPNPFNNSLFLNNTFNDEVDFKLYDLLGRLVYAEVIEHSNQIQLNGIALKDGLYIAELNYKNTKTTIKLLKN